MSGCPASASFVHRISSSGHIWLARNPSRGRLSPLLPGTKTLSIVVRRDSSTVGALLRMAPIMKKRARIEGNPGSRKRPKHDQDVNRSFQKSSTQPVSLDTLPWQEVAFPESGFEDAEGFFGLEEISGVEVVKDPELGKVEYRVCQLPLISSTRRLTVLFRFPRTFPRANLRR